MPRLVACRIHDRDDGLFDAVATLAPDKTYRREGFASLAAVEEWIDGLRTLMAAIGAPLVLERPASALSESSSVGIADPSPQDGLGPASARLRRFRDAVFIADDETD